MRKKYREIHKKIQKGFTIIELMVVVAVIAVIASIALPAYTDYTTRAKVAEAMNLLGGLKVPMVEFYWAENRWPSVALIGGKTTGVYTSLVESKIWNDESGVQRFGVIATMKEDPKIGHKKLIMMYIPEIVDWECTTDGLGNEAILDKYLPGPCRL